MKSNSSKTFNFSEGQKIYTREHSPELHTASDFPQSTTRKIVFQSKESQIIEDIENLLGGRISLSVRDSTSTISPLGFLGYGFCGLLVNLCQVGLYPMDAMVLSIALCYGGIAQFITGIFEWKKGNMLTAIVCASFGCFNFSNVFTYILIKLDLAPVPSKISSGINNLLWSLLLLAVFVGNIMAPFVVNIVLGFSAISFFIYAISDWNENENTKKLAAVFGIIACSLSIYSALATIVNESLHKILLPLGQKRNSEKK